MAERFKAPVLKGTEPRKTREILAFLVVQITGNISETLQTVVRTTTDEASVSSLCQCRDAWTLVVAATLVGTFLVPPPKALPTRRL